MHDKDEERPGFNVFTHVERGGLRDRRSDTLLTALYVEVTDRIIPLDPTMPPWVRPASFGHRY
jgi:antirestriction protein ArdC